MLSQLGRKEGVVCVPHLLILGVERIPAQPTHIHQHGQQRMTWPEAAFSSRALLDMNPGQPSLA